jgi:transcriptional regulator with XRE-family HTH domain
MHAKTLIALAVQQLERKSVRGLAERLEVSHALISDWQRGEKPIPNERIRQIAKVANQDAGPWLLLINAEQEHGELGKEWAKLAKRLTATAALLVITVANALPGRAQANAEMPAFAKAEQASTLCIMRN